MSAILSIAHLAREGFGSVTKIVPDDSSVRRACAWLYPTDEFLRLVGPTKAVLVDADGHVDHIMALPLEHRRSGEWGTPEVWS